MLVKIGSLWALSDISSRRQLGNKVSEVWEEAIRPPCPQPPTQFWVAPAEESSLGGQPQVEMRLEQKRGEFPSTWDTSSPIIPGKYYDMPWGRAVVQAE